MLFFRIYEISPKIIVLGLHIDDIRIALFCEVQEKICLAVKSNQTNYFIVRLKVDQRAGQLSLRLNI